MNRYRKTHSAFFPASVAERIRANIAGNPWAAQRRDEIVRAADPWTKMTDAELRGLMFGNTIQRAWQVWSNGYCPTCRKPVTMFNWSIDALRYPWKLACPHCGDRYPKNDFGKFYESGLDEGGVFRPARADRSLLFHAEHPDPKDPLHKFGVDDGDGYVEGDKRWRFIGNYLIYGQWRQLVLTGIRNLAAAYLVTGEREYGRKAGVILDRVADLHPTFDFFREGIVYQQTGSRGYVSIWHNASVESRALAIGFDQVFDTLSEATRQKFTERVLLDVLANRPKIESNYPSTDVTIFFLNVVLGWPENRAAVFAMLDPVIRQATAVDGMTGEKGPASYAVTGPAELAQILSYATLLEGDFLSELFRRHPRLHPLYRFHIDTWCLGKYYPLVGDGGYFGMRCDHHRGVLWDQSADWLRSPVAPSMYSFFWRLYEMTGDVAFVQVLYRENGTTLQNLPHDLVIGDNAAFQCRVQEVIDREGAELKTGSINKQEWCLALLRSGQRDAARAAWVTYDSWGGHGHASGMNIGLFAKGLDLIPENGYAPLQIAGFQGPHFDWYWSTAMHNTVVVDGRSQPFFTGQTTAWQTSQNFQAIRVEPVMQSVELTGPDHEQFGFYCHTLSWITGVALSTKPESGGPWTQQFTDCFDRPELGPDWRVIDGEWKIENGQLTGHGTILCARKFPGRHRLEYTAGTADPRPCDLSAILSCGAAGLPTGAYFGFGWNFNQMSVISFDWRPARRREATQSAARIVPGKSHQIVCERDGLELRHIVDGELTMSCRNDGMPHLAGPTDQKRYARTLVLVDISEHDFYLVDVFEVGGGQEHAKFFHSDYGEVTTAGLALQPAADFGHGTLMRNFRTDAAPRAGWSADWKVNDRHSDLPAPRDIHVRYTDLTEGAEASLCEGWVAVRGYESAEEAWIPRIMVRRQSPTAPLSSTFVAVIEPYEGQSNIMSIRRVGPAILEILLRDGRRDVVRWSYDGEISLERT